MPTQPVSSRRARIEEQRAKRNLILAILFVVVVGVLFVMFAMPVIFRLALSFGRDGSLQLGTTDTIAPQRPEFQPPEEYLNTNELTINGFTEAKAKVELTVDGQSKDLQTAADDGSFTLKAQLEEGEHEVFVTATDEAGNIAEAEESYLITVDTTAPTIEITAPEEGKTFSLRSEQTASINGKMSEAGTVRVNGSLVNTDDEGNFTVRWQLGDGENTFTIYGEDKAGNKSTEQQRKVFYRP